MAGNQVPQIVAASGGNIEIMNNSSAAGDGLCTVIFSEKGGRGGKTKNSGYFGTNQYIPEAYTDAVAEDFKGESLVLSFDKYKINILLGERAPDAYTTPYYIAAPGYSGIAGKEKFGSGTYVMAAGGGSSTFGKGAGGNDSSSRIATFGGGGAAWLGKNRSTRGADGYFAAG